MSIPLLGVGAAIETVVAGVVVGAGVAVEAVAIAAVAAVAIDAATGIDIGIGVDGKVVDRAVQIVGMTDVVNLLEMLRNVIPRS
jgi:chorismate synthase